MAKTAKKAASAQPKSTLSPEKAAFIKDAAAAASASQTQTGVPASVTVAQAILESGWGEHHMGDANNYFGIKAQVKDGKVVFGDIAKGFVDRNTKEFDHAGHPFFVTAHFRKYDNMTDSFTDHGMFLKNGPRYSTAMVLYSANHDANQFAQEIQKAGYATDPNYAQSLISLMTKQNLYRFNNP